MKSVRKSNTYKQWLKDVGLPDNLRLLLCIHEIGSEKSGYDVTEAGIGLVTLIRDILDDKTVDDHNKRRLANDLYHKFGKAGGTA